MTNSTEKFREFFELSTRAGEVYAEQVRSHMDSMADAEVENLADRVADFYSAVPGDPIRHLIAEVVSEEYARRFNGADKQASDNIVAFPINREITDPAARISRMALDAAMVATNFMSEAEALAADFISDVDAKLEILNDDELEIVGEISAEIFAGETCSLDQSILSEVIDVEFARRSALSGRLRE